MSSVGVVLRYYITYYVRFNCAFIIDLVAFKVSL
jgi:hypothetical protein